MAGESKPLPRDTWGDPRAQAAAVTLAAFVLRMIQLTVPVLRWDEGWTIAHASLPWPQLLAISAAEWHPPLYYGLMKLWLGLGAGPLVVRYLSVLLGTLAVPLAYHVGRLWGGSTRTGVFAALLCAWAPLLVYYGQVARMYPLATLWVLLAGLALLKVTADGEGPLRRSRILAAGCLCGATFLAVFTQYYAAWPLAALYVYGLIRNPRRIGALVASGAAAVALFVPWLVYAYPALTARLAAGAGRGVDPLTGTLGRLRMSLDGLLFYNGAGWYAPAALALIVVAALAIGLRRREDFARFVLPFLAVLIPVLGISYGAQASGWAAPQRHMMLTVPLALLALAWALARLSTVHVLLPVAAVVVAVGVYWPTSADYVYAKNLEVVDPFDPGIDEAYIHAHARPDELVFFNVLARAGWYESRRAAGDPDWSYAMRWDPIIEPMPAIIARVRAALEQYPRIWFVMHEGTYGPNEDLVQWLDGELYPASAEWRADPPMTHTLYLSYVAPAGGWMEAKAVPSAVGPADLRRARYTASTVAGGPVAVELAWAVGGRIEGDYTVFVHWLDNSGALVAQHDGVPGAGLRPTSGWAPGEEVIDRHGARLPDGWTGVLEVVVGWYNPATGERIGEPLQLGDVRVTSGD